MPNGAKAHADCSGECTLLAREQEGLGSAFLSLPVWLSPWSPTCLPEIQTLANKGSDAGCPLFPERLVLAAFWARGKESESSPFQWMLRGDRAQAWLEFTHTQAQFSRLEWQSEHALDRHAGPTAWQLRRDHRCCWRGSSCHLPGTGAEAPVTAWMLAQSNVHLSRPASSAPPSPSRSCYSSCEGSPSPPLSTNEGNSKIFTWVMIYIIKIMTCLPPGNGELTFQGSPSPLRLPATTRTGCVSRVPRKARVSQLHQSSPSHRAVVRPPAHPPVVTCKGVQSIRCLLSTEQLFAKGVTTEVEYFVSEGPKKRE